MPVYKTEKVPVYKRDRVRMRGKCGAGGACTAGPALTQGGAGWHTYQPADVALALPLDAVHLVLVRLVGGPQVGRLGLVGLHAVAERLLRLLARRLDQLWESNCAFQAQLFLYLSYLRVDDP